MTFGKVPATYSNVHRDVRSDCSITPMTYAITTTRGSDHTLSEKVGGQHK